MNEMHLHTAGDLASLARGFVAASASTGDPFARPLLLVPGAGVQRWLSQQAARTSADDGEGIFAGFEVHRWGSLERLLVDDRVEDPWVPERLVWSVLGAVGAAEPGLEPLAAHLAANDQRYANALRIARLFRRYADHRPGMLEAWSADPSGAAASLGFDAWQVHLWSALRRRVGGDDPVSRRTRLAEAVSAGSVPVPWPAVHVFAPRRSTVAQRHLVQAVATRVPVHVWLPTTGPADTANELARALGRASQGASAEWHAAAGSGEGAPAPTTPDTALGRLQAAVLAGRPVPEPVDDGSITIHASHAAGRQVEVLREVLTGLFADDPTLEPREVVVACPDPTALAPHLAASFGDPAAGVGNAWRHPATGLRLRVVEADATASNQLFTLLRDLLTLGPSRATTSQLLALAAHPFVARRFGWGPDHLDRLEELVAAAAVRWGINPEHRARFGLGDVVQNTWQLGVQRLVLGEAFSDDHLTSVGVVATVDDVSSTDTALVGALAELVSRVSRLVRDLSADGSVAAWVERLRRAVDLLADVPFAEAWQLSQVWSALGSIEARGSDSRAPLAPADALALLTDAFAERGIRPAFGSGALVVCSLEALARVPHRVVCLVGLDERSFPRRGLGDGDDLVARDRSPGDPDPGADDRQAVLDAVLAARDHLVVVYQGQSSLTPEPHHPPAGVQELVEAIGGPEAVRQATLQGFAWPNFAGRPSSFDVGALAGARSLVSVREPAPDRWAVGHLHRTGPLTELGVERLAALVKHPGRFLLRERADVTLGDDEPLAESIALELGFLEAWQVGDAMLASLRAGHRLDAVTTAQWLSGDLPPRQLGAEAIRGIADKAQRVHQAFLKVADAPPEVHVVDLEVEGVRLTGRHALRGGLLAESHYGTVAARHLGEAWVRLLALTVQLGRRTDAVLVGGRGTHRLSAPPVDLARQFLADLVVLAGHGTERVLPLPPRVGQFWAEERAKGRDPRAWSEQLEKLWRFDRDEAWKLWFPGERTPWALRREPDDPWGHPEEDTQLGALAARVWEPIRKATL